MKKRYFISGVVILLLHAIGYSQQWIKRVNGTGNGMDAIIAMSVDKAGNVYVTGYSFSGANDNDYVTIKYNASGVQQWLAKYNGPGNGSDVPSSIFVDNAGYVYVTGSSDALTGTFIDNDVATIKYSPQGVQLWAARYAGTIGRADAGTAIKADATGNVFITGYTTVHVLGQKKIFLTIKYNSSGVQQWLSTYQGIGQTNGQDDAATGLALDPSGNVYVTGYVFAGTGYSGRTDYLTVKYNSSGIQQWTQQYNGPGNSFDYPKAIAVDNTGNVFITGYSVGFDFDFATIKYNTNGLQQWIARYNGPANSSDIAYALALDDAGNVYVTGSDQKVIYNSDFLTVKYNSAGVQQWTARYNGPSNDNDEAYALAVDKPGNVYVTGYINGVSPSWDIATIKYNTSGTQQWINTYNGPKDSADVGNGIGVDSLGNVYVGGASTGKKSAWDYTTIKYSSSGLLISGVQENHILTNVMAIKIYPNPAHNFVLLQLPADNVLDVTIFDVEGRQIFKRKNMMYESRINCANFPKGVYFLKAENSNYTFTQKFTKQ